MKKCLQAATEFEESICAKRKYTNMMFDKQFFEEKKHKSEGNEENREILSIG